MNFLDILSGTPWWVFALFIYLVIIGVKASYPNEAPLYRLLIIPIIFIAWSLFSICQRYGFGFFTTGFWLASLIIGAWIGLRYFYKGIRVNKDTKIIHLAGSWYPLFFFMTFFMVKYCIGFTYAVSPEMSTNIFFVMTDIIASGFISGISGGRFLNILHHYQQSISR